MYVGTKVPQLGTLHRGPSFCCGDSDSDVGQQAGQAHTACFGFDYPCACALNA
jgi:hypothetical protein